MGTYADDFATLIETLGLNDTTMLGHSTGGGEVVPCLGRRCGAGSASGADRRRTTDHAENGCKSRRLANGGVSTKRCGRQFGLRRWVGTFIQRDQRLI